MKRTIISIACAILSIAGWSLDVESIYYETIAGRKTGVYEQDGMVYFHTSSVFVSGTDDHVKRRTALLAVRKMMFDWVAKHASPYERLPERIRKIDSLWEEYEHESKACPADLHVSGRGFTDEKDGRYTYCLAVPSRRLLREADKGVPGKTESEILTRWKTVCARELSHDGARKFLAKVGCGDITAIPQELADKLSAECSFLDGWDASSPVIALLKTTGRIEKDPEELWMEGLSLIAGLKDGKIKLADAGVGLQGALLETPGSPVLWCYLGEYLKDRRLYRLSAVAYKNAFCLSANIGILPLLKSSVGNLAHVYRILRCDTRAEGFDLLALGIGK